MSQITASVVLYNTPELQLTRLLDSIAQSTIPVETYLIDNSPVPLGFSCAHFPRVTYLKVTENKGYGAGHNIALRKIIHNAAFHFVLNPDIYFGPAELEKMIGFMEHDPEIGQVMPKILYPDGNLQYLCKLLPTPVDLLVRRFSPEPFRKVIQHHSDRFELRFTRYESVMDVPCLSGCFMLLRTSALREIGLFDERFFMYLEDFDLTRRIHAQFRTVFFPGATVVHDHARESYKKPRALWNHIRSAMKYFNKWGWLLDAQRSDANRSTLQALSSQPHNPSPLTMPPKSSPPRPRKSDDCH